MLFEWFALFRLQLTGISFHCNISVIVYFPSDITSSGHLAVHVYKLLLIMVKGILIVLQFTQVWVRFFIENLGFLGFMIIKYVNSRFLFHEYSP